MPSSTSDNEIVTSAFGAESDVWEPAADVASTPASASKSSYGEILKSSTLIGGSQVMNVAIGIARTKAMAMLLGPSGFGIAGLYNSIVDLTQNIAGLGVNSSGVRQIAEAVASGDADRIALTVAVLRRTSVVLGAIGALALLVFSPQISAITFGTRKYALGVAALSIAAFCKLVSGGQNALIQGMRRIADMAKISVLSGLLGACIAVTLVYFFRERGIVLYVIAVTGMSLVMSWWYSRKVCTHAARVTISEVGHEAKSLLKLGFAFMISSLVTLVVAYVIRVIVLRKVGIDGTGFYQSAWTIGGLYVSFILQAMGADFYPRLTGCINDHDKCNRLVNEQAHVGLLLAGPGVIATLTIAPLVMAALYSTKFAASVPILRWICLGATLQVITWPMGFIIVAKGRQNILIFTEVTWGIFSVALGWFCIERFGLPGAGVAFFLSYVFHGLLVYPIVHYISGFRWSADNLQTAILFFSAIGIVFSSFYFLPSSTATAVGAFATFFTTAYAARILVKVMALEDLPTPVRTIMSVLRLGKFRTAA
jgi:enterobacterial common antigen flippase